MFSMFDWLKLGVGGLAGAAIVALPVYFYGVSAGKHAARVEQLEADVKAYEDRKGIDHEVGGMDRYDTCLELGGLPDDCGQLRGVDEAAGGE